QDPIDVVYLSKKFTATPIFTPHFRAGVNTSFFHSIYSVSTEPYPVTNDVSLRFGIQVGAGIDWNLDDNFSLCVEGDFSTRGYQRTRKGVALDDAAEIISRSTWLDIPLYFKYAKSTGQIRYFFYGGYALNVMFSTTNEFTYTDNKLGGSSQI